MSEDRDYDPPKAEAHDYDATSLATWLNNLRVKTPEEAIEQTYPEVDSPVVDNVDEYEVDVSDMDDNDSMLPSFDISLDTNAFVSTEAPSSPVRIVMISKEQSEDKAVDKDADAFQSEDNQDLYQVIQSILSSGTGMHIPADI